MASIPDYLNASTPSASFNCFRSGLTFISSRLDTKLILAHAFLGESHCKKGLCEVSWVMPRGSVSMVLGLLYSPCRTHTISVYLPQLRDLSLVLLINGLRKAIVDHLEFSCQETSRLHIPRSQGRRTTAAEKAPRLWAYFHMQRL